LQLCTTAPGIEAAQSTGRNLVGLSEAARVALGARRALRLERAARVVQLVAAAVRSR
jgi:hypothetical protein